MGIAAEPMTCGSRSRCRIPTRVVRYHDWISRAPSKNVTASPVS